MGYEWRVADRLLDAVVDETALLVEAAGRAPDAPVPSCPGWSARRVLGHVGRVHRWVHRIVIDDIDGEEASDKAPPPHSIDEAAAWATEGAAALRDALGSLPADTARWTWLHGHDGGTVGWWSRRLAIETLVHRADAELAAGLRPTVTDGDVGAVGVDELLDDILPARGHGSLDGTLHLHRTDGPGEWLVELTDSGAAVTRVHAKGDAAIRGHGTDLCLFLWNRVGPAELEVFGDEALVAGWADHVRF